MANAEQGPVVETGETRLPVAEFIQAAREVAFAAAPPKDRTRENFQGILFDFQGQKLSLVASDRFRMSVNEIPLTVPATPCQIVISPKDLWEALDDLFPEARKDKKAELALLPQAQQLGLKRVGTSVERWVPWDANCWFPYPDYKIFLSPPSENGVTFERREFLSKLRFFDKGEFPLPSAIRIESQEENGEEKLHLWQIPRDHQSPKIEAFLKVSGRLFYPSALRYRYLWELLQNVKAPQLRMETFAPRELCVFRKVGEERFVHLIMPMA